MAKTKKLQGGGLDANNMQPGSSPSNSALDLTGGLDRSAILQQQLSSLSSFSALSGPRGGTMGSMYRDPFVTAGVTDPTIVHPIDSPESYQMNWTGDWGSMVNDHRNRVKEFRIMALQDRAATYQNMLDQMNSFIRDIDRSVENGDMTKEQGDIVKRI